MKDVKIEVIAPNNQASDSSPNNIDYDDLEKQQRNEME
jgi:hypothetical protein